MRCEIMRPSGKVSGSVPRKRGKAGTVKSKVSLAAPIPSHVLGVVEGDPLGGGGGSPAMDSATTETWDILRALAADTAMPAAARASAARTLAEMQGSIGRHAPPPPRHDVDVAQLSRAELVQELERLRAQFKPDIAP